MLTCYMIQELSNKHY